MNNVYLFTLPELLTEQNLDSIEIKGLAEWSDHVPDLFLLLIGGKPASFPWAAYNDGNHPPAFVCDWDFAALRLDALLTLAKASGMHELAATLVLVTTLMHQQRNLHLVLHVVELALPHHGRNYGKKGFKSFIAELVTRANDLDTEFAVARIAGCITAAQPRLWKLCTQPLRELGYWDARIEEGYWLDGEEPAQLPSFLQEFSVDWDDANSSGYQFDPKLGAYEVRQCVRKQAPLYGIVTAYGRWLLPLGEAQPLTNRYELHTTKGWITLLRPLTTKDVDGEEPQFLYALLDANGVEVLPFEYVSLHTVGDKLVYFRRLADYCVGQRAYKLMRIDTGQELPGEFDEQLYSARDDGFIEAGLEDGGASTHRGLLDRDGNRITEFVFEGFSEFHQKHKLAMAKRGGKWGLINQQGRVVLPLEYDRIAQKRSDGPPHFHGDATLIFTIERDAEGQPIHRSDRVGVADKHGRVLVPPRYEPWHLQWAFNKEGQMLVHENDVLYFLNADGTLSEPAGSRQALLDEMAGAFRKKLGASRDESRAASDLAAQVDRAACDEFIDILCRDQKDASARIKQAFAALLAEGETDDLSVREDDQPAALFFRVLAFALRDECLWMHLDWKAVDEIAHAQAHLPDVRALASFQWDGIRLGEDIHDGFAALDAHLAQHGFRLIHYQTGGDYYLVGVVATNQLDRCLTLAGLLGIPLAAENERA